MNNFRRTSPSRGVIFARRAGASGRAVGSSGLGAFETLVVTADRGCTGIAPPKEPPLTASICGSGWDGKAEAGSTARPACHPSPRNSESGRGDWIRTSDPLRPRQVRYQAALRPDSQRL